MYKGVHILAIKTIISHSITFISYMSLKKYFENKLENIPINSVFLAGSTAGVISTICSNPVDVIVTKYQSKDKFVLFDKNLSYLLKKPKLLFTGTMIRALRAIPGRGIEFYTFEKIYNYLT